MIANSVVKVLTNRGAIFAHGPVFPSFIWASDYEGDRQIRSLIDQCLVDVRRISDCGSGQRRPVIYPEYPKRGPRRVPDPNLALFPYKQRRKLRKMRVAFVVRSRPRVSWPKTGLVPGSILLQPRGSARAKDRRDWPIRRGRACRMATPQRRPCTHLRTDQVARTRSAWLRCGPDSSSNPADKDGFLFRLTVGLRKVESDWHIAHEHHSVPATE